MTDAMRAAAKALGLPVVDVKLDPRSVQEIYDDLQGFPKHKTHRPCTAHDQLAGGQCGNCLGYH